MDLGCIDMGCVEKHQRKESTTDKDNSPKDDSVTSASKSGKINRVKDGIRSSINALSKLTSQITKPPRHKTSPVNWIPRKKMEPYLNRKIKMLQEVDGGMLPTLDETLGDTNPHYSRVLREKIAIKEAAEKSMEARKAAMVEASWCRILQAARIQSKEAEAQLLKAETAASEALEVARAVGVIMNEVLDSSEIIHYQLEANLETEFEVDKQVAFAVKAALIKLANCPLMNKDGFKELLRKISENPDMNHEKVLELSDFSSECELEVGSSRRDSDVFFNKANLVDMMLDRLRCLKDNELASLATIVATCGLNAALAESEGDNKQKYDEKKENPCLNKQQARRNSFVDSHARRRVVDAELPSLDKFLVKKLTRLEREVLEARNARKSESKDESETKLKDEENAVSDLGSVLVKHMSKLEKEVLEAKNARENQSKDESETKLNVLRNEENAVSDLGSVLVKHTSKLEKEVEEARMKNLKSYEVQKKNNRNKHLEVSEIPSLDKYLVKRLSKLEREVEEARRRHDSAEPTFGDSLDKENKDLNKKETNYESLDKVLVKRVSRLERDKLEFREAEEQMGLKKKQKGSNEESERETNYESLDKVLVKRVSRLERAKLEYREAEEDKGLKVRQRGSKEEDWESLDQVLVKHKSRLEREKMTCAEQVDDGIRHFSVSRRQAREKELQNTWGGLSLGNSMIHTVSRLERDKAAWIKAEEEEKKREVEQL